ncbi:MAG: DUF3365 domain-containing protein [Saprospiraceae bacterium]
MINYLLHLKLLVILISVAACTNTSPTTAEYLEKGKTITSVTFVALSQELKTAYQQGGMENAVQYCNIHALPITDSLAQANKVQIKRVSDRVRNPQNIANVNEKELILNYKKQLEQNEQLKAQILTNDDNTVYYQPILLNEFCLNCHGTLGKELDSLKYQTIKSLYPEDRAIGYQAGDLRGMWKVTFYDNDK